MHPPGWTCVGDGGGGTIHREEPAAARRRLHAHFASVQSTVRSLLRRMLL